MATVGVSLAGFVLGAGWAALVCLSLLGCGDLLCRLLRLRCTAGETACLGVGAGIAAGGLLNLLHCVLPLTDAGFVILGAAAGVRYVTTIDFARMTIPRDAATLMLLAVAGSFGVSATLLYCYNFSFQIVDDVPAYMAFPTKMLSGTLGFEPFSERRLITSLGGMYFLHSLVLTGAGYPWLHVIDPAFALVVLIALLEGAMRPRHVPPARRLLLYLFLLLFLPKTDNLTATLLPVPLFLLVYWIVTDPSWRRARAPWQRMVCLAIATAALIALKTLYVVPLGGFLVVSHGLRMIRARMRIAIEASVAAALTVGLLLPWMIAGWCQTGTLLYPFLGIGFGTVDFDAGVVPLWQLTPLPERLALFMTKGLFNAPVMLLLGLYLLLLLATHGTGTKRERRSAQDLGVWIMSALLTVLAICLGGAGEANLARYSYPGVAASILLVLYRIALFRAAEQSTPRRIGYLGGSAIAGCAVMLLCRSGSIVEYYDTGLFNLRLLYSGPARTDPTRRALIEALEPEGGGIRAGIRRMQAAVPPGETILERIDFPFHLDFRRNAIFIADWPGSVGPSPGWPVLRGSRQLASYLAGQSVRYIAWSYGNEALFPTRLAKSLPKDAWVRNDAALAYEFQDSLSEMMRICPLTFDDGMRAIIHISNDCIEMLPMRLPDSGQRHVGATTGERGG